VPAAPLGLGRLELQHERLSRRLVQIRVRRAHVGRGAPEFEQLAVTHPRQARPQLADVEIGFQRQLHATSGGPMARILTLRNTRCPW